MFTGLIEETGIVKEVASVRGGMNASFTADLVLDNTVKGDSISINGICQTVTRLDANSFSTEISAETLKKTTARFLKAGDFVNLERAMSLGDRLGGHLVQGHVNGTGTVLSIRREKGMDRLCLAVPGDLMKFMIDEGSVAVDGISLTIARADHGANNIEIQIIPHSFGTTTLRYCRKGDQVNIETDMIGRYVETLLAYEQKKKINGNQLRKWGYGK